MSGTHNPYVTELDVEIIAETRILPFTKIGASASYQATLLGGWLLGWAVGEASGTAVAKILICNGGDAGDEVLAPVTVLANDSKALWMGDRGLDARSGLFIQVVSGTADVTVWLRPWRQGS